MQDVMRALFSSTGRINRKTYWTILLCIGMAGVVLRFIIEGFGDNPIALIFLPLALTITVAGINNYIKRLHDLGRSGWWILAALGACVALGMLLSIVAGDNPAAAALVALSPLVPVIWLGSVKGEPSDNRFGPAPAAGDATAAFD